ncbi:F0F1-type ATP synthase membrane subunit c/vacuolar-type H+-ATPase subunit K [Bradyrhizobium sp. i1.3.6]
MIRFKQKTVSNKELNSSRQTRGSLEGNMLRGLTMLAPALVAGIAFASTSYAIAEDVKLPATLTFTRL